MSRQLFFFMLSGALTALVCAPAASWAGEPPSAPPSAPSAAAPGREQREDAVPSLGRATIPIVVNVSVNTVPRGDIFAEMDEAGLLFIPAADFDALKLSYDAGRAVLIRGERYLPLSAVLGAQSAFDEKKLALSFIGKTTETGKTVIDVYSLETRPQNVYHPRETSAFLNYGLTYSHADDAGFQSFTATSKLGISSGDVFFVSDSLYTKTQEDDRFVRLQSSATYERRSDLQWFVLGDRFAGSGELGSSLNMGGIGVSKVFRLNPYFITQPVFNIRGATLFPTQAEIWVDGALISRQALAPGAFELNNLYSFNGSHTVELVLRDPFGNEQRISHPAYFSTVMLRQGLHEYSYNAGFLRERYGVESNEYGKPAFSAFHRYGATNSLNVGARAEGSDGVYNGGLSAALLAARLGLFSLSAAGSDAKGAKGSAAMLQHSYQLGSFSTNLLLRGFSKEYATVMSPPDAAADRTKSEVSAGAGFLLMPLGGVSLVYSKAESHAGTGTRVASVNYSRGLTKTASLYATASETRRSDAAGAVYSVYVGLNINLDGKIRGSLQHSKTDGTVSETVQAQKDVPVGQGFGWRAAAGRTESGGRTATSFNPFVQYNGRYGIYSADAGIRSGAGNSTETYALSVAGSFVYAGGFFGASRPVNDSFSLVMVDKVPDAAVFNNGQEIGKTNSSGALVVPTLASYGQNRITLDVKNIPMEYSISGVNKSISPSLWSGSCIAFDAVKSRAVMGRLVAQQDSGKMPVEYQEGTLAVAGRTITFPTGRGGEFYIESALPREQREGDDQLSCRAIAERRAAGGRTIPPGAYAARIEYEGRTCVFTVTFPETEDVITDLGEVRCAVPVEGPEKPAGPQPAAPVPAPAPPPRPAIEKPAVTEHHPPQSVAVNLRFSKDGGLAAKKDRAAVAALVRHLQKNPGLAVVIEVHGDRHGSGDASRRVGLKQADAIRKHLLSAGVRPERIAKAESVGSAGMLCAEETPACDRANRRGVIRLVQADAADAGPEKVKSE